MKDFFKNPIVIVAGIILTLGILAIVGKKYWGWFGGKAAPNSVPDTFYGEQCGGVAPTMRVKWYKDSGKFYSIMELLPNAPPSGHPPTAHEVSEETYLWAYKQVKKGCSDVNLPRMANEGQSFAVGGKVPIQVSICNKTKIEIQKDGSKIFYKINNVIFQSGQYWEVYVAPGHPNSLYKITQQEYMNYINKCVA